MDLRKLKTIIEIFESSSVTDMEFVEGDDKVKLSRQTHPTATSIVSAAQPAEPAASPQPANISEAPAPVASDNAVNVTSPMVGTFYRAPSPEQPPFVKVGQRVEAGQTICIIEAMKLMNEIPATTSGTVEAVHVTNGDPVAYGDVIVSITPE